MPDPTEDPVPARDAAVQALVVSGFLGSGKTTLVRHLLEDARQSGVVMGVVSNEFGELGIDAALLAAPADAYVELEGGCVCCKLSDALVETLETLRTRVQPERIVVETSGVALPHETQIQFWREPVAGWVGDVLAVVVVNAEQLHAGRDLEGTFVDQVGSADLLVLNKLDLVPAGAQPALEERLADWAPDAPVLPCVQGRIAPEILFPERPRPGRRPDPRAPHTHEAFVSEEWRMPAGIDERELVLRLEAAGALRIKGFVETAQGARLVQGVGPRIEIEPIEGPPPAQCGRLVLIRRRGSD